jgi:hypothetical protein
MSSSVVRGAAGPPPHLIGEPVRVAFVGAVAWVDGCTPSEPGHGVHPARFSLGPNDDPAAALAEVAAFRPHVTVVFDPGAVPAEALETLPGTTLGVLVAGVPAQPVTAALEALDRLVSFAPSLTGMAVGGSTLWRAIPPPVGDSCFGAVRPLHRAPRTMAIGRSTEYRESVLMAAKHHHDLLQVIHGVTGETLVELLAEHDVGVYVSPEDGGGFGQQVGVHLAAGHLLLAGDLTPSHGLERDIDYLHFDSPEGLVWMLDRLARFPEMHQRVRVRGRLKAEQYRASRLFARLAHDLLADVAAFS